MAEKKNPQAKTHAPVAPVAEKPAEVVEPAVPEMFAQPTVTGVNREKNYVKTVVLSSMFGWAGVDRFYLGKIGTGVLKLVTFGGFGIWYLVDFIIALVGGARQKDKEDQELEDTARYKPFFVRLTLVWVGICAAMFVLEILLIFILMPALVRQFTPESKRYELVCLDRWTQEYLRPEACPDYNPNPASGSVQHPYTNFPGIQVN